MTASAPRPTPNRGSGGRPPAAGGPLARRLAPAGIALPILILAGTLCAVAADIDLGGARALWIPAAAVCAAMAAVAWADILRVVHRRRPTPRPTPTVTAPQDTP
ncbi:hypothetical protein [Embleya sp. NPDC059259]|uniref:hypothetical protein n=1 Tax=unclassified Embleya TaxID=2699296 RepID=UPI00368808A7